MSAAQHLSPAQFHPTQESVRHITENYRFADDPGSYHDAPAGTALTGPKAWKRVTDNFVPEAASQRSLRADIARNGVKEPIRIDYHQDPPLVTDGHTRLFHAQALGMPNVPVKHGEFADVHTWEPSGVPTECAHPRPRGRAR